MQSNFSRFCVELLRQENRDGGVCLGREDSEGQTRASCLRHTNQHSSLLT